MKLVLAQVLGAMSPETSRSEYPEHPRTRPLTFLSCKFDGFTDLRLRICDYGFAITDPRIPRTAQNSVDNIMRWVVGVWPCVGNAFLIARAFGIATSPRPRVPKGNRAFQQGPGKFSREVSRRSRIVALGSLSKTLRYNSVKVLTSRKTLFCFKNFLFLVV